MTHYAVNVADLTHPDVGFVPRMMVMAVKGGTVECEKNRMDGMGLVFNCPEERAEAIVAVLRMKLSKQHLRLYRKGSNDKTWKKI